MMVMMMIYDDNSMSVGASWRVSLVHGGDDDDDDDVDDDDDDGGGRDGGGGSMYDGENDDHVMRTACLLEHSQ